MNRLLPGSLVLGVCAVLAGVVGVAIAAQKGSDHEALEAIMKDLHKGKTSVASRAMEGSASKEEITKLAEAYQKMLAMTPPRGDAAEWKKRCEALVAAIDLLGKGDAVGAESYKKAVNCKACHTAHKPE